ncbi:Protein TAR1 [Capsicum baccatum]|uniref:Protein TAR1 n=1 Tax=Capsicum baccatum TaxID=33114 RepID=A0A2G2UYF3_CAPBA|nr:Protein TAR1 [Capsicum baccatum]
MLTLEPFSDDQDFDNDPYAGSPLETLLRILLPLNDKVQWISRDVAGSEPPTSTRSEHFIGSFNRYAHTRTLLRRSRSVGGAPLGGIPPISFLAPYGFTRPLTRTHVRLLGPCFKTGRMGSPQASVRSAQMPKHAGGARCLPQSRRRRSTSVSRARALAAPPIHAGPRPESIGGPARRRSTSDRGASPAPIRFPPDNFKHSLTLFSKSFSSFPRGTCSLSVSRPYLALDGIHRPIWAAFPNNPTRRQRLVVRQGPGTTGLSPSPAPPSRGLGPGPPLRTLLQTTIRTTEPPDSKAGLFPRVVPPDLGSRSERLSAKGSWSPNARRAVAAATKRVELQPPLAATSVDVDSHLGQPRARGLREASIRPATTARPAVGARCEGGDAMRDAQADVPSA